jgi:hypothetical protein
MAWNLGMTAHPHVASATIIFEPAIDRGGVLKTNKVAGCPGLKTPAEVVFYLAQAGYVGPDHVKYEVTSENGEVATNDVTIVVKAPLAQRPALGDAGVRPL